jgi:hypothetical protein
VDSQIDEAYAGLPGTDPTAIAVLVEFDGALLMAAGTAWRVDLNLHQALRGEMQHLGQPINASAFMAGSARAAGCPFLE